MNFKKNFIIGLLSVTCLINHSYTMETSPQKTNLLPKLKDLDKEFEDERLVKIDKTAPWFVNSFLNIKSFHVLQIQTFSYNIFKYGFSIKQKILIRKFLDLIKQLNLDIQAVQEIEIKATKTGESLQYSEPMDMYSFEETQRFYSWDEYLKSYKD